MARSGHRRAVGFDDIVRAQRLRDEIVLLGGDKHYLVLRDVAVFAPAASAEAAVKRRAEMAMTQLAP